MERSSVDARGTDSDGQADLTAAFHTQVGIALHTAVEIIYRRAVWLTRGDAQLAQDLTQDVLTNLVKNLRSGTLTPVVEPRPWLRTLVNNQLRQHLRSEGRIKRGGTDRTQSLDHHREHGLDPPADAPGPEDTVVDRDMQTRLRAAVDGLEPPQREVVELMLDGHSHREIAEILGIPENTSKTRLRTAVKHLRGTLCPTPE
jgi:RNA polymerase sigma factor (sigma-70 family)